VTGQRDTRGVRFRIVDGYRPPFDGRIVAHGRGLSWSRPWSLRWWTLPWTTVQSCTLDRDRGVEVAPHTIRLLVFHDGGCLDIAGSGPRGALALAGLREAIRRATLR
jgi:hypothetical protein